MLLLPVVADRPPHSVAENSPHARGGVGKGDGKEQKAGEEPAEVETETEGW